MTFALQQRHIDEMIAHAREDVPNECCGVLLGRGGQVDRLRRCINAEHSPFRYSVDPRELLEIDRESREHDWDVISIYHSHTHTEAYPSPTDVRLAGYPEAIYILVSLQDAEKPDIRGYYIRDGVITEEPLEALKDEPAHGN
jgi:proteasome lid subunit RPN8/RPN11